MIEPGELKKVKTDLPLLFSNLKTLGETDGRLERALKPLSQHSIVFVVASLSVRITESNVDVVYIITPNDMGWTIPITLINPERVSNV